MNQPDRHIRFSKPLAEFIRDETADEYTRPDIAREEVIGSLQGAFLQGLLAGDDELFRSQWEYAVQVHRYFMEKQRRTTNMDMSMSRMELMSKHFRLVAAAELIKLLRVLDLDDAETLYNNAPDFLRQFAFDEVRNAFGPAIAAMQERGGRPFNLIFPEPPGMDEHRAAMRALAEEEAARRPEMEVK
jgi:hypothetical protein